MRRPSRDTVIVPERTFEPPNARGIQSERDFGGAATKPTSNTVALGKREVERKGTTKRDKKKMGEF